MSVIRPIGKRLLTALFVAVFALSLYVPVNASPFGQGVYGADVPFGSSTALSVSLSGNVNIPLSQNGGTYVGTGSHTVTVTSTDVVGYSLYAFAPTTTNMVSGSNTIPASGNGTAAALATNTWGYNITGSTTNFLGMTSSPSLLTSRTGPYKNGDTTTVTYGVVTDLIRPAGSYSASVVYTVMGLSQ